MNTGLISLIGIILGLLVFIIGVFKGYHITLATIVASGVVILFSWMPFYSTLTAGWVEKFVGSYKSYFLLFFFSALFAKFLGDTGAAQSIAFKMSRLARKWKGHEKLAGVFCLILIQACLTYGGVSLFVVVYTVLFIGKTMFEELDIPWKFYVMSSVGSSTFTLCMLPGSPQVTNLIPVDKFGTTAAAAPVLGLCCTAFCLTLCISWVVYQVNTSIKKGEHFLPTGQALIDSWDKSMDVSIEEIPLWQAIVPSIFLLFVLNVVKAGNVMSLIYTCLFTVCWFFLFPNTRNKFKFKAEIEAAVANCNRSIVALASAAGFGGVVALAPGFAYITGSLDHIPGPKWLQVVIAVNLTAGFCGSSSAGLRLSLDLLGDRFMTYGIPMEALHRLCSISAAGLDSLPHASAVVNNYYVAKNSFKDSYINNFMFSVVFNILTAIFCGILISIGITF